MRVIIYLAIFLLLVAGGVWWLISGNDSNDEDGFYKIKENNRVEQTKEKFGVGDTKKSTNSDLPPPPKPPSPSMQEVTKQTGKQPKVPIIIHKKDAATEEDIVFVTSTTQWVGSMRIIVEHIHSQIKILKGAPIEEVLGEGAEPIDLFRDYAELKESTKTLAVPEGCEEATPIISQLEDKVERIVNGFSNPPTLEELEASIPETQDLIFSLNDLYRVMNNYCQT